MLERRTVSLTEGPILSGLVHLFWPIMLGALLQQCYNTIDVAIVGNYLGKEALAAVGGTSSTMTNLMMEFLVGISSGAAVIIAQNYGAGREQELRESIGTAVWIGAVLGLILGIAGIAAAPVLLRWLNAPPEIAGMAQVYLRTYFCGLLSMSLYNTGAAILQAVGDTRRPLYFLIGCCTVNLVLDLLFVAAFGWGILGAVLATVISQTLSAVLVLWVLVRSRENYRLSVTLWKCPAGDSERKTALTAGVAAALLLSGLSMAGGRWFFRIFTDDTAVRETGLSILYFMMP